MRDLRVWPSLRVSLASKDTRICSEIAKTLFMRAAAAAALRGRGRRLDISYDVILIRGWAA